MTTFARCADCGALDAPWSRGHRPSCPSYQPPTSGLLCPVCGRPLEVLAVDVDAVAVTTRCTGCGLVTTEDHLADEEEP